MTYESLIFDIDGTLWDSRALVAEGYNIQLRRENLHHLQITAETLLPLFGKTMTAIADGIFASIQPPERYALMDRCIEAEDEYLHQHPCDTIAYPNIYDTIQALSRKHRLFIVSNGQKGYPQLAAEKLGISQFITGYLSFGDTGTSKDLTIRRLMEVHSIENAVYIGDTQGDQEACRGAGIDFIFCDYGFGQAEEYVAVIHKFRDLLDL